MTSNQARIDQERMFTRSISDTSRTIVIYSNNQEFEPHPLKFIGDVHPNDVNSLVRETIENIKTHIKKPGLRVWDASQNVEIDYNTEAVHHHDTLFLSEVQPTTQFEIQTFTTGNPLITDHKVKGVKAEHPNSPMTPSHQGNVFSDIRGEDIVGSGKKEGPIVTEKIKKPSIALEKSAEKSRERSISAAKMFLGPKDQVSEVLKKNLSPNKSGAGDGFFPHSNEPSHHEHISNHAHEQQLHNGIENPHHHQHQHQYQEINIEFGHAHIESVHQHHVQNDLAVEDIRIDGLGGSAEKREVQKKVPFPPTGHIATVSIEGNDPFIYTHQSNEMPFSFLLYGMPPTYNPKLPPPTYLSYDILSAKRDLSKAGVFHGLEIKNNGILKLVDPEVLANQKGLISDVLVSLAQSLKEGRGVIGVSLPVRIFEPRSLIERLCDLWTYIPKYLLPASQTTDQIERIKLTVTMFIASMHLGSGQLKPFNPILGETYQAHFPGYGITIDLEHTSHHPPIANFIIKHEDFQMWGQFEFIAKIEGFTKNTILMLQEGATHIRFKDGQKLTVTCPYLHLEGMMHGDRTAKFEGNLRVVDEENKIKAIVKIGDAGDIQVLPKKRVDVFHGKMYKFRPHAMDKSSKKTKNEDLHFGDLESNICDIYGMLYDYLNIGGNEIWKCERDRPVQAMPVENPLPSDSRFREDLIWIKRGNKKHAQEWKVALEIRQRLEKKFRQEGEKKRLHGAKKK